MTTAASGFSPHDFCQKILFLFRQRPIVLVRLSLIKERDDHRSASLRLPCTVLLENIIRGIGAQINSSSVREKRTASLPATTAGAVVHIFFLNTDVGDIFRLPENHRKKSVIFEKGQGGIRDFLSQGLMFQDTHGGRDIFSSTNLFR